MNKNNYNIKQTCSKILKTLSSKEREIISRRFGLGKSKKETLESIGKDFGVTRERVRQIEKTAFLKIKSEIKKYQKIIDYFKNEIKKTGNLRKQDSFLSEMGGEDLKNEVHLLLTLSKNFEMVKETNDFYSLWAIDRKNLNSAKKIIKSIEQKFKKTKKPLKLKDLDKPKSLSPKAFNSYLEISKKIQRNEEGFWGLREWPEINPRTIKDKAHLVFKKVQKPLHFNEVAGLIDSALPQTVHNELIKDSRFVLVGRGMYALKEWGYQEGLVKDVLLNVLKKANHPLKKEEILEKVLKQRMVKENTVFLNLSDKKRFSRTPDGHYKIREA